MSRSQEILSFIDWVLLLMQREEHRANLAVEWQPDMSWKDMGWEARVMIPGEIEPPNEVDQYLPGYAGLLDTQLYWSYVKPGCIV